MVECAKLTISCMFQGDMTVYRKRISCIFVFIVMFIHPLSVIQADAAPLEVWIKIDLWKRRLYLMERQTIVDSFIIGVGKEQTPSPIGRWKVIEKSRGWGGGFGTHWLGLNVPWGTYGIHGTNRPSSIGRDVSHGCIRMLNTDIEKLYPKVPIGTTVYIEGPILGRDEWKLKKLVRGDAGTLVMLVQNRLRAAGIYKGPLDGIFGQGLERAVKRYQKEEKLEVTGQVQKIEYLRLGLME